MIQRALVLDQSVAGVVEAACNCRGTRSTCIVCCRTNSYLPGSVPPPPWASASLSSASGCSFPSTPLTERHLTLLQISDLRGEK